MLTVFTFRDNLNLRGGDMTYTGSRIKYLRKLDNLTQQQLADALGVAKSTISMYETGQREPDFETLEAIADYFNVEMRTFFPGGQSVPGILPLPANKAYPLVGDIACGTPILAEENISEYIQFPDDMEVDFCLRCRGDSMVDARIYDGDIVFIRQQPEVENGEIAAVLIGEETTLKRVYRTGDTLTLVAANSAYAPMVYTGAQLENVRILGKAVSFLSTVK